MSSHRSEPVGPFGGLRPWPRRILSFLTVYVACALLFQLGGATPSWGPGSSLEAFSAGLFAMLAVMALVLAKRTAGWHKAFWVASFCALAALGADEVFELHESGSAGLATDHLKVGLWIGAAGALAIVHWLERPSRGAQAAMAVGYALHTVYLVAELGDGGYFNLPLAEATLELSEGIAEVLMLSAYLLAFGAMATEPDEVEEARELDEPPATRKAA